MRGDITDITGRLRAVLPIHWFADRTPNLDAILTCIATPWVWLHGFIRYVMQQCRLTSASGQWLDLIAYDFFGHGPLLRRGSETDTAYRDRIQWTLIRSAATRMAVSANLQHLTGSVPQIFEPSRASDTGAYGSARSGPGQTSSGLAYGLVGGWGSLQLPFGFFVNVQRPNINGVSLLSGYGIGRGGYGVGAVEYLNQQQLHSSVTDEDIAKSLSSTLPISTIAWLRIT